MEKLKKYLRPGEKVFWQGKTEEFSLLERDAKRSILAKWIGSVTAAVILLALYIRANEDLSWGFIGIVVLIVGMLVGSPILEKYSLMRQRYWITDQRAILMTRDNTFYSIELKNLDDFQLVQGKTPQGSLVIGSCLFEEINRQMRWRACHPKTDVQSDGAADAALGLVFFNVPNAEGAAEALRQQQEQAKAG